MIAGNGFPGFSGDGGPAIRASLNDPRSIAIDRTGDIYVADFGNQRIRRISRDGTIATFAGGGTEGEGAPASRARLGTIGGIAFDPTGTLYVSQLTGARVWRVTPEGILRSVAGTGTAGNPEVGKPARETAINYPVQVATDAAGNLFIACLRLQRVLRVGTDGVLTTAAGTGTQGFSGDDGPAAMAQLSNPSGVAVDRAGNLFIADTGNHRVRKVAVDGTITTVAGNGQQTSSGDGGPALEAGLMFAMSIAVKSDGSLAVAGPGNRRIRVIGADGKGGHSRGNGRYRSSGDGAAIAASFVQPGGIALTGRAICWWQSRSRIVCGGLRGKASLRRLRAMAPQDCVAMADRRVWHR